MQGKQVRARKDHSPRTETIWALHKHSWPRLALMRRPLTPPLVRKPIQHPLPSLQCSSRQSDGDGNQWQGLRRGAASSDVAPLGPGWLKCSPRLRVCLFRPHSTFGHSRTEEFEELLASSLQQREFLVFLRCLMVRKGEGGAAGAGCRLGCRAPRLDKCIVLR